MLHPTFNELSKDKFNRYQLAIAAAKCARQVTDEYVNQREAAEKSQTGNKETDKPVSTMIDQQLKDEKAVKIAIERIYNGQYTIVEQMPKEPEEAEETEETEEAEEAEKNAD
ncbi:MAG: DNA-directed RNA polymerase subunit omega [Clostridia bacterium]|nr:DNA-directed RNA polymerase subunit omega [Clostridia bacterium]